MVGGLGRFDGDIFFCVSPWSLPGRGRPKTINCSLLAGEFLLLNF